MSDQEHYKKIVIPIDGSGWSERAIPHACRLAKEGQSELILLHIFKPPANEYTDQIALAGQEQFVDAIRDQINQYLLGLRNKLRSEGYNVRIQFIEAAGVAHQICDYINDEGVDLVVMSTHGRSGLARFVFGSVANKVMHGVHVPVMLIHPDKEN